MIPFKKHIQNIKPYEPGKPIKELQREYGIRNVIKLASNENPLGPSGKAISAMRRAIRERDTALTNDPCTRAFGEQLTRLAVWPKVPEWEPIASKLQDWTERAVRGGVTTRTALVAMDKEVDQMLEKRRWLVERRGGAHASLQDSGGGRVSLPETGRGGGASLHETGGRRASSRDAGDAGATR